MPETRTYDPAEGDDLAQLIRAQLGETIRPVTPGIQSEKVVESDDGEEDGTASIVDLPRLRF